MACKTVAILYYSFKKYVTKLFVIKATEKDNKGKI